MENRYKYELYYSQYDNEVFDSRWAEREEIEEALDRITFSDDSIPVSGVPFMSDGKTVYVDGSDTHSIIIGSTGSKKSRNVAFPTVLMHIKAGQSVIVLDDKGEIFDLSSGYAKAQGYDVFVLNLREPSRSHRWNPFAEPWRLLHVDHNVDKSREMINDFVHTFFIPETYGKQDPYWDETSACMANALCEIIVTCASEKEANIKSLSYLRSSGLDMDAQGYLIDYARKFPKDSYTYINLSTVFTAPDRTRSCIVSTFDSKLRLFNSQPGITELFSGSDFDVRNFGDRKSILYIIAPDEKTTYAKLITTFVQQSYQTLIGYASSQPGRRLKRTVNYLLDEFAQLPHIKDFCSAISAARSRNVRFSLYIQSLHQLRATYGESAETILANTGNMIFLTSRELPLLERIASLCGYSKDGTYLISPSRLQRLKNKEKGEALILVGSCYPYITNLCDISQYGFEPCEPVELPRRTECAPVFELIGKQSRLNWLFDEESFCAMADGVSEFEESDEEEDTDEDEDVDCNAFIDEELRHEIERKFDELFGNLDDTDFFDIYDVDDDDDDDDDDD